MTRETKGYWYEPPFKNGEKVFVPLLDNAIATVRLENPDKPIWIGTIGENLSKDFWAKSGGKYGTEDRGYPLHFSDVERSSHNQGWNGGIGIHLRDIHLPVDSKPGDRWHNIKSFPDLKLTHDGHLMKDKLTEALEWFIEEDIYKEPFIVREKSTVTLDNGRKMEILKSDLMECPDCKNMSVRGKEFSEGGVVCITKDCGYWFCY